MKPYIGWIIAGILAAIVLYLVFRPVPKIDNSVLVKKIDSLTNENNKLRKQEVDYAYQSAIEIEGLNNKNDSLRADNGVLKFKNDVGLDERISLAKQVQYYSEHKDTVSYDSACDLLAKKNISDSVTIRDYQINTDKLIANFSQGIEDRDSLITFQSNLIVSDSTLIAAQRKLNGIQTIQLNQMTKRAKVNAWLARAAAVAIGALVISIISK